MAALTLPVPAGHAVDDVDFEAINDSLRALLRSKNVRGIKLGAEKGAIGSLRRDRRGRDRGNTRRSFDEFELSESHLRYIYRLRGLIFYQCFVMR